jgi:hypothetical protein
MTHRRKPRAGCPFAKCLKACRPGRPLCKLTRGLNPKWITCQCDAYPFPHRFGGGLCQNEQAKNLLMHGPAPQT